MGAFSALAVVAQPSLASSFTISNVPASVGSQGEFSVSISLSISGSAGNTYYLRAAFAPQNSPSSYFGYTKNNSGTWYNGKPSIVYTQFFQITMDSLGNWGGTISVKPDITDSSFSGSGDYVFKVGRYTSVGSGPTWSDNSSVVTISAPTPTPTPQPTSTPTPTPTVSPTATPTSKPTSTPIPSPTSVPTSKPTSTPTPKIVPTANSLVQAASESTVLSAENSLAPSPTPRAEEKVAGWKTPTIAAGFVLAGLGCLGFSGYSFWQKFKGGRIKPL